MRVAIPKQFTVGSHTYDVRFGKLPKDVHGETRYAKREIIIAPGMDRSFTEHTFLHELMHVVANALGDDELNDNEGKVDAIAGMLHQFLKTKKGDLLR